MVWAAGVKGATIKGLDAEPFVSKGNRILVNEFNQVKGFEHIFAIGDVAQAETEEFPFGYPMMAQPAMQQGESENLVCRLLLEKKKIASKRCKLQFIQRETLERD